MEEYPDVFDGTELPEQETPLNWEELIMILSTTYGIRCAGSLQDALQQRRDGVGFGDSLALPSGFPFMVFDLENNNQIRRLEEDNALDREAAGDVSPALGVNVVINGCLNEIRDTSNVEEWEKATLNFGQRLEFYDQAESRIICRHFTDAVLECLRILLSSPDGDNTAFCLIRRNTTDPRDRKYWGGIGKSGKGTTSKENIWREIVVFPKVYDVPLRDKYSRQAFTGLLRFYRNLANEKHGQELFSMTVGSI